MKPAQHKQPAGGPAEMVSLSDAVRMDDARKMPLGLSVACNIFQPVNYLG